MSSINTLNVNGESYSLTDSSAQSDIIKINSTLAGQKLLAKRVTIQINGTAGSDIYVLETSIANAASISTSKIFTYICEGVRPISTWSSYPAGFFHMLNTSSNTWEFGSHILGSGTQAFEFSFIILYRE